MKIIVSVTLDGRSAGSWYAIETAGGLRERGHEILFLCRPQGQTIRAAREAGLNVVEGLDLEEKSPLKMYANLRRLIRLAGTFGPDAVLAHWGEDHSLWGIAKAIALPRMALVRVRALDPKPPKKHPLSRWLHRRPTDMIVTVNRRLHAAYRNRLGIPDDKLQIIEAGVDPARFRETGPDRDVLRALGIPPDENVVVLLARFSPVKGHRVLLSAMPQVLREHPRTHFLWLGVPSEYNAAMFRRWFVEGDLVDAVTVVDRFQPDLEAILRSCTIGLVTSRGSESVSRSLLEYFASGLPAVATDVGGVTDLMRRGEFGALVPPDDPGALATAINQLLAQPDQAKIKGQRAREYVLDRCTWDHCTGQWEDLLYRVVSRVRGDDMPRMTDGEPPCDDTQARIDSTRNSSPTAP